MTALLTATEVVQPRPERPEIYFELGQLQRRWTVAVRLPLVLPVLVWLVVLTVAAGAVRIIGWVSAIIHARLPAWCRRFLVRYLTYNLRVTSYLMLLVDTYPGFRLPPAVAEPGVRQYPITPIFEPATPLNRWAVAFREILAIPVVIVSSFLITGWMVVSPIIWLLTLLKGRMPNSAGSATAAVLRSLFRTQTYQLLVTAQYPGGFFGDDLNAPNSTGPLARYHLSLSRRTRWLVTAILVIGAFVNITRIVVPIWSSAHNPEQSGTAAQNSAVATITAYYRDVARGDAAAACAYLAPRFAAELAAANHAQSCADAVARTHSAIAQTGLTRITDLRYDARSVEVSSDGESASLSVAAVLRFNGLRTNQNSLITLARAPHTGWFITSLG